MQYAGAIARKNWGGPFLLPPLSAFPFFRRVCARFIFQKKLLHKPRVSISRRVCSRSKCSKISSLVCGTF